MVKGHRAGLRLENLTIANAAKLDRFAASFAPQ
jgi:hypothetical protein